MRNVLVVVDPIKSGTDLRASLSDDNVEVIDVYTVHRRILDEFGVAIPKSCRHIFSNDPHVVAALLRPQIDQLRAVIPASEPATSFAARLAYLLDLPSNHNPHPDRFRDKEIMRLHARNARVQIPEFVVIERGQDFEYPQSQCCNILKPLKAAGAEAVKIVANKQEAIAHMQSNLHDLFGNANNRWLLEEYVAGPEFAINTVSSGGCHLTIDVWEYCQPTDNSSAVYDNPYWNALQIGRGRVWDELTAFASAILDGFMVEFGFCHIEVKLDMHTRRWHLIEIASRLPGAGVPWMWRNVWGVNVYGDLSSLYGGQCVSLTRYLPATDAPLLGLVFIRNERAGILQALHGIDAVRALPEFVNVEQYAQPGDFVAMTDSLQNPLAKVMIKAVDRLGLEAAAAHIRQLITICVKVVS